MKYSVIIPIDLKIRPFNILNKVKNILNKVNNDIEVVFGHNDRNSIFDIYLKKIIRRKNSVKLVSGNFYTKLVCQSLLRNRAVDQCSCDYIYLMDVDCLFDKELSDNCIDEIKNDKSPFIILPCLYLSKKGSRVIYKLNREEMFNKYISFKKDLYLHLAIPSANIFMKKKDYIAIGGFDENFTGHGGEDFEFMIKLALFHKNIKPTKDLMLNRFYKAPLLSQGFRKYLALNSLPYFFEKKLVFHIYHSKNKFLKYFRQYHKNSRLLQEKIQIQEELQENSESLLALYENLCQEYGVDIDKYAVLFDSYKPRFLSLDGFLLFLRRL